MVAVVVGESLRGVPRAAAKVVEVEYEPLAARSSAIAQAIAAAELPHRAARHPPRRLRRRARARARTRFAGELDIGGQEHFYLETHAAWAERGDDGDVFVCSSTQHPSEIQAVVSHVLHLPRNKVVVESPRMGGGFGGKETQGNTLGGARRARGVEDRASRCACSSIATST